MNIEKIVGIGLSYRDVYLVPQRSDILSRYSDEIDLSTEFARGVKLQRPYVSANMDTVTEARMAIALAREGGLGVIHRAMTPEQEAEEVRIVKAQMSIALQDPLMINETATVRDAKELLERKKRGYVVVTPAKGMAGDFLGIATIRDFTNRELDECVAQVMTPKNEVISVLIGTTLEQAVEIMEVHGIEKVPVIDNNGLLVGMYTLMDYKIVSAYPRASKDSLGRLMVAAAIGVKNKEDTIKRAHLLEDVGVDALVIDIAHGALTSVDDMLHCLKVIEGIRTPIVAGNVAMKEHVKHLVEDMGVDGVKVGIGPGKVCRTKNVAGVHVPQFTAILNAAEAMAEMDNPVPIIADGGIEEIGDISKAIGAGADTVMMGTMLAAASQAPGEIDWLRGTKTVRGMATEEARRQLQNGEGDEGDENKREPEGEVKDIILKGGVEEILFSFEAGLRSGMTYTGARTIKEMQKKAKFIQVL